MKTLLSRPNRSGAAAWQAKERRFRLFAHLAALGLGWHFLLGQSLPEPGLVQWGTVQGLAASMSLRLSVETQTERVEISTTLVFVNGQAFYQARIPFEARTLPNGPVLPATPNTLDLTRVPANYNRSLALGGNPVAFANPAQSNFTFSAAKRGSVERADLVASGAPGVDSDGDGMGDAAERLAGTDPNDKGSVLKIETNLKPEIIGGHFDGIVIQWSSIVGKSYRIERSEDLARGFSVLRSGIPATAPKNSFRDASAKGAGPYFYRLQLE